MQDTWGDGSGAASLFISQRRHLITCDVHTREYQVQPCGNTFPLSGHSSFFTLRATKIGHNASVRQAVVTRNATGQNTPCILHSAPLYSTSLPTSRHYLAESVLACRGRKQHVQSGVYTATCRQPLVGSHLSAATLPLVGNPSKVSRGQPQSASPGRLLSTIPSWSPGPSVHRTIATGI